MFLFINKYLHCCVCVELKYATFSAMNLCMYFSHTYNSYGVQQYFICEVDERNHIWYHTPMYIAQYVPEDDFSMLATMYMGPPLALCGKLSDSHSPCQHYICK
jgi:hypothetical protein